MLKKIFLIAFLLLLAVSYSSALEISSCRSGDDEWVCQTDKICVCKISGDCTNGNLFVYNTSFLTPLCLPKINNGLVNIEWDQCQSPTKQVKVRANCDEGQSLERIVQLTEAAATTTSSTTRATTTTLATTSSTTSTRATTTTLATCPYQCCVNEPGYLDKSCEEGFECCPSDMGGRECKKSCFETEEKKRSSGLFIIIAIVGLIVIVGLVLYFTNVIKLPPKKDIYKL